MKCHICGLGPVDMVAIYRQNKPGEMPAVWACREHRTAAVADDVQRIVDAIESPSPGPASEPKEPQ